MKADPGSSPGGRPITVYTCPLFNAAVLWNTVQIERAVGRLQAGGTEIDPADLAHVWPLQHARIIPNGTYFLNWSLKELAEVPQP